MRDGIIQRRYLTVFLEVILTQLPIDSPFVFGLWHKKALAKIVSDCQGNKYVLAFLISRQPLRSEKFVESLHKISGNAEHIQCFQVA